MSMDRGRRKRARLSDVPPFVPPARNTRTAINTIFLPATLLCIFWGLFVFAGMAAFYRYDVR